jgi:S-adenosylmethionine synthetase
VRNFVMTSESVTVGHPDKLCDQISDAVIDACLTAGTGRRVVVECALATGIVFLSVRGTVDPPCDLAALARRVISDAGYDVTGGNPTVMLDLAPDHDDGPAQRGQMTTAFGYACDHSADRMPLPIRAAHRLTRAMDDARRNGRLPWLLPDAQAQVAVAFIDRRPVALPAIALAFGVHGTLGAAAMEAALRAEVIAPAFAGSAIVPDDKTRLICLAMPDIAGAEAHSGQTGRKTADDCYGGFARHSAAALSGKGPGRIDRTAQYAARQAACAVLAAGLAQECEVQLSYVLGDESPASVEVDSFDSGQISDDRIARRLAERFDFRAGAIAERMCLWTLPGTRGGRFYRDLAVYGHMARQDLSAPWEDLSQTASLV